MIGYAGGNFQTVDYRQTNVGYHDIGPSTLDSSDRFASVFAGIQEFKSQIAPCDLGSKASTHDFFVIDNQELVRGPPFP